MINSAIKLFEDYKKEGKISEALIICENIFNKNNSDSEIFNTYFDYLLYLGNNNEILPEDRMKYIEQAEIAVSFFSENTELSKQIIEDIIDKRIKIQQSVKIINNDIQSTRKEKIKKQIENNEKIINNINVDLTHLENAKQKSEFDNLLDEIGKLDSELNRDCMIETQKINYEKLTKRCTQIVEKKLKYFEQEENRQYNLQAIKAYKNVFDYFKGNQTTTDHKEIIKRLFAYDSSKLYNETLVYYNHVYSFVLSKLDDEGKFALTQYAIMSEGQR